MSFLPIFEKLKAVPELTGYKIYEDVAPYGTKPPYIVWQVLSGQALNDLDEPANFDNTQYQVVVYAPRKKDAYQIRDICRKALEHDSFILNPSINTADPQTKLYGRGFDANWIQPRG